MGSRLPGQFAVHLLRLLQFRQPFVGSRGSGGYLLGHPVYQLQAFVRGCLQLGDSGEVRLTQALRFRGMTFQVTQQLSFTHLRSIQLEQPFLSCLFRFGESSSLRLGMHFQFSNGGVTDA